jgi:hypothetical protein
MLRHRLAVFQTYVSHSFVLLLGVSLFDGKLVILMALVLAYNLFKHLFVNCAMFKAPNTKHYVPSNAIYSLSHSTLVLF